MSWDDERRAGGLAIGGKGRAGCSRTGVAALEGANLLQLLQIVAAVGELGNGFPEFSFTYLLVGFRADKLPQFAAAQLSWIKFQCVHSITTSVASGRPSAAGAPCSVTGLSVICNYDNRVIA